MKKLKSLFYFLKSYLETFVSSGFLRQRKRRRIQRWVQKNSLFYQGKESFPILSKADFMQHFDQITTTSVTKKEAFELAIKSEKERDFSPTCGEISVGLSSGTSGHRGLFMADERERALWAGSILGKVIRGEILKKMLKSHLNIALFLRANNELYERVGSKKVKFKFFDLIERLDKHWPELESFSPDLIIAPPSVLRFLAQAQKEKKINIAPLRLYSAAEVLEPLDQRFIEGIFQQKVHQIYQCTEGFLGISCWQGNLHLNEDLVAFEKERVEGNLFYPIITDLNRRVQPIIRYRLNDLLEEDPTPCACGSSFIRLKSIQGRSDDIFYGNEGTVPIFPDFIRRMILVSSDEILEYEVLQTSPNQLEVALKIKNEKNRESIQRKVQLNFENLFKKLLCSPPSVDFKSYSLGPSDKKMRRIKRLYEMDN